MNRTLSNYIGRLSFDGSFYSFADKGVLDTASWRDILNREEFKFSSSYRYACNVSYCKKVTFYCRLVEMVRFWVSRTVHYPEFNIRFCWLIQPTFQINLSAQKTPLVLNLNIINKLIVIKYSFLFVQFTKVSPCPGHGFMWRAHGSLDTTALLRFHESQPYTTTFTSSFSYRIKFHPRTHFDCAG